MKNLDIDALPPTTFDTTAYKPFAKTPGQSTFNYTSLPGAGFNMANLPAKSLQFKTSLLVLPPSVKSLNPSPQIGKALSIFYFGIVQGLEAKIITALFKDKNGLMWIASFEGIFRYDGNNIQPYPTGPAGPPIAGMAEDKTGKIWYIRHNSIGMVDPHSGTLNISEKIGSQRNNVAKMITAENGLIWVYNDIDKAVSIIDPEALTFKNLDQKAGLSDSTAFGLLEDDSKNIWITTFNHGANIIDLKTGTIKYLKQSNGLGGDTLSAIAKDKTGVVWIATSGKGVDAVDTKRGIIKHYNELQGLEKRFAFNLSFDNKGILWMATNLGIELLSPEKGMSKFIGKQDGLNENVITSCIRDSYERMWVGSTQGLHIIEQNGEIVRPLGATIIISQMEDTLGNLWVGTDHGIILIDPKKNIQRTLNKAHGLANDFVQSFAKSGQQILVTTNGGLDIIDPVRKTIEHTGKKEGLVSDTTYVVFKDRSGNKWLTGPSNGIDLIDPLNKMVRHTGPAGGLSDNNIQDIKQDNSGKLWLATSKGGINIIDLVTGNVKYLNNQPGLRDTCTRMMLLDKYDRVWIGTDKGIYIADSKKGLLTTITTREGLSNNRVLSLLEYNGSVIVGTSTKINIITAPADRDTNRHPGASDTAWKISVLNRSEGLVRQQRSSWNTDLITNNGQYLWGDRGLTVISEIRANDDPTRTFVTGVNIMTQPQYFINKQAFGRKDTIWTNDTFYLKGQIPGNVNYTTTKGIKWDSVSGPYNMPVNLRIPNNQNYIQVRFTRAHLSRQDSTLYCYFLEGIDKNWSAVTANTFTENYLNLPPGKYIFKVSSKGINGKWSDPAVFAFTISPPWYNSWWAYTLFVLLGIGILRAYIVYRSRKFQEENRLLEEKVSLRTSQLQQSIEELKATQTQLVQ
ncbi:MAG: two-component regulator propeller domain-containing protein, partial [Ferruginibacter sp.]